MVNPFLFWLGMIVMFAVSFVALAAVSGSISVLGNNLLLIGVVLLARSIVLRINAKRARERISFTTLGPQTGASHSEPRAPLAASGTQIVRGFRVPSSAWLGIFLVVLGFGPCIGFQRWLSTRILVPVDMPVSLGRNHIRTGPFRVNVNTSYTAKIGTGEDWANIPNCNSYFLPLTRWVLYRDGNVIDDRRDQRLIGEYIIHSDGAAGTYDLDVEVLSDASCFDPNQPRLTVTMKDVAADMDYAASLVWLSALSAIVGLGLLLLAQFREHTAMLSCRFTNSGTVSQYFPWAQKMPLKTGFSGFPPFGLVAAVTFFFVLLPLSMLFLKPMLIPTAGQQVSLGLAGALKPAPDLQSSNAWPERLIVRIEAPSGVLPNLYLNSKSVSWESFAGQLRQQFVSQPPDSPVYVLADPNVPWQSAMNVIDIIRGEHLQVVLLRGNKQQTPTKAGQDEP